MKTKNTGRWGLIAALAALGAGPALAAPGYGFGYPPPPAYGYGPMPRPYAPPPWMHRVPPSMPYGVHHSAGPGSEAQRAVKPAGAAAQQPVAAEAEPAQTLAATVTIARMRFEPASIVVKKGTTVTWTQNDAMPHTVTAGDGSFGSPQMGGGGTFSHTFDEAGTYAYACSLHPAMQARVQVVE